MGGRAPEPAPSAVAGDDGPAEQRGRRVRVLIVDDHEVLTSSLAIALNEQPDLKTVAVAATLKDARALMMTATPDVVLLDHRLPDGDGVSAIPELQSLRPSAGIVILTASVAESVLLAAIEAGAAGFVSKTRGLDEVTSAVRAAGNGETVISPELLRRLLPRLQRRSSTPRSALTERENEVLALVADGMSNAAIARQLSVSVHTVRNHIANLSAKLGAHSKLEALSIAVREGLLPNA
jgi:DNA-binding NarL/FixJ family response regulator